MFTRVGESAYKANLDNTLQFCQHLGNPQQQFKSIHIGGTNGKGSTSHMLAAILQTAGYKTGLYTSPHLRDFRERIRINGEMISEKEVVAFVQENKTEIERIQPSFFEATVAMAFQHFAQKQVDIAVIEVGLGGRLDSTNIITPELSVITNIGYDHMHILGNTLPEIAGEKAGIIKPGIPVVIGQKQEEVADVFINKARETNSEIIFASDKWDLKADLNEAKNGKRDFLHVHIAGQGAFNFNALKLDLSGIYQLKNLATVLSAVKELKKNGFVILDEHIQTALQQVKSLTGLMGRWQTLSLSPLVIADTGHNEDGIREVLKNIAAQPHQNLHMVIGMVKDKDISKVLQLLPKTGTYYFCQPDIPRAKPLNELEEEAKRYGLSGSAYPSVKEALEAAKKQAATDDLIFVGGSTFVVAEVI